MKEIKSAVIFLIIFFSAAMVLPLFVSVPIYAAAVCGFVLTAVSAFLFGVRGVLPAIAYSSAIIFFAYYILKGYESSVIVIFITALLTAGLSIAVSKEYFKKKEKNFSKTLENLNKDILSFSVNNELLEKSLDSLPYMAWLKNTEGQYIVVNEFFAKALVMQKKEIVGRKDLDFFLEKYAKKHSDDDKKVIKSGKPVFFEETVYFNNKAKVNETYKAPLFNESGEVMGTFGYSREIKGIKKNLFESKKQIDFFHSIIDNIPVMLFLKDAKELRFRVINKATEELLGISREEMLDKNDYEVFPKKQADFFVFKDREALKNKSSLLIEEERISYKGRTKILSTKKLPILDENSEPIYIIGISEDITEKKQMEKTIKKFAYFDEITNLPNRNLFKDRFSLARENAKRNNKKLMILMLDFDKFKIVNDKYGHDIGDKLLRSFAARTKKIMRKTDTFARFGGDEFVMLISDFNNTADMEKFALKILDVFKEPFKIQKLKLNIKGSLGISVFPDDSTNYSDLVKFADSAMYVAKAEGGSNYKFYSASSSD